MNTNISDYQLNNSLDSESRNHRVDRLYRELCEVRDKRERKVKLWGRIAVSLWLVALAIVTLPNVAKVLYWLTPDNTSVLAQVLGRRVDVERSSFGETLYQEPEVLELPPEDPELPRENMIRIPKVGVDTRINGGDDWEKALETGVWHVPGLGDPENPTAPMIVAAHRFGYLRWNNEYRRAHSFYNLPKLENGDTVEVIWNRRKYVYEVFEGYSDENIRDFKADLIFYTCEFLNSDQRIIRHARLLEVLGGPETEVVGSVGFAQLSS